MKIGIVTGEDLAKSDGLRLDAEYYLDPYGQEIRAAEKRVRTLKAHLQTAEARLIMWERKRDNRLKELE